MSSMPVSDNIDALLDSIISSRQRQHAAVMEKDAGGWSVLGTGLRGIFAGGKDIILGRAGVGGLLKTLGRLGGAQTQMEARLGGRVIQPGTAAARGATDAKEIADAVNKAREAAYARKNLANPLKATTHKAVLSPDAVKGQNPLQKGFQRLGYYGQRLIDSSQRTNANFSKSLAHQFGKNTTGHKFARGAMKTTAYGAPIGYMIASPGPGSEDNEDTPLWAAPGKAMNYIDFYGSAPGWVFNGLGKAGDFVSRKFEEAAMEGVRYGAQMTAAELANLDRSVYAYGALNPTLVSEQVHRAVMERLARIQAMKQGLN